MANVKLEELDLYEILEINVTAPVAEIKKAYRKKALKCHPDKNPDDDEAAKKFHQLTKILEILLDEKARSAYDKVLKGRKEAALRHKELDGKRRKLKEELEEREKRAYQKGQVAKTADEILQKEIERLRKEGSRQVEEEMENILHELKKEATNESENLGGTSHKIKIKWKAKKNDQQESEYTQEVLHQFLSKYGEIQALIMSPKKKGSALVEFKDRNSAQMAIDYELGLSDNPLKLEWVNGPNKPAGSKSNLVKDSDFESVTLTKLRQAEERKRLIAQMMAEDDEN